METTVTSFPAVPAAKGITQYPANRPPLTPPPLACLPAGAVQPRGWIRGQLNLMTHGMAGRLSEISLFLGPDNGWLGGPGEAWEEQPYWYRGFYELAVLTADRRLTAEAMMWMETLLSMTDKDGYWGPQVLKAIPLKQGGTIPDLWPHMIMLDALTSHYDRTGDSRVIPLMLNFFRWVAALDDRRFLPVKWSELMAAGDPWQLIIQMNRPGDMLPHLYWLYNRTGEPFLLDLATRFFTR
ncbi:MAG: glycoside hydrolase family 127 protein, partial [Treponema sp.]|nr:glycoside hydrolase family 127 protein [Treponema sp.]